MKTLITALVLTLAVGPAFAQDQAPRMGGVLKIAVIGEPPSLDLHTTTATITYQIMCARVRGALHVRQELHADAHARRELYRERRRAPLHHRAAQGGAVSQRQGDDLGRRGRLAHALGQGRDPRQDHVAERRGHRGQGPVDRGDSPQAGVERDPLRTRGVQQCRRHLSERGRGRGGRRAGQGVHRHRALPVRRAQARSAHQARPLQGLQRPAGSAQRPRGQAGGLRRRDPLPARSRRRRAAGRGRDRRVPLRPADQAGPVRADQEPARSRAAHHQAECVVDGGPEPQGRRDDVEEDPPGVPGGARHGADHGGGLRQQGLLPPRRRGVLRRAGGVVLDRGRGEPTTRRTRTRRGGS